MVIVIGMVIIIIIFIKVSMAKFEHPYTLRYPLHVVSMTFKQDQMCIFQSSVLQPFRARKAPGKKWSKNHPYSKHKLF